jgi:penicillin-binding protein 1A
MSHSDISNDAAAAEAATLLLPRKRGCAGLFFAAMLILAALWGSALGAFVWILQDAKSTIQALETFRPKQGSKVYSSDGELLGEFSDEQRQLVNLSEIPLHVQKAFIATEDDEFYRHKGVRPSAVVNAALSSLMSGKRMRGASTITQQVVRNIDPLDVGQERTVKRKLREIVIAMQVERDFTKDEILELYLNQVFLGVSAFGVEAASQQYYGKHCWDLSLGEAALLAGLARWPNTNNPFRSLKNAKERRDIVLVQMLENKYITQEEYEKAVKESAEDSVITPEERKQLAADGKKSEWRPNKFKAPYFVEEIRQGLLSQADKNEVFQEGLEIHTTLDWRLQQAAEDTLFKALDEFDAKKREALKREGKESEFTPVSGALVCIDNRPGCKGFIRAMVGGRDFEKEKYNTVTQAKRQPGSSIKPFVWATAISNGLTPSTIEMDLPYTRVDPWGNVWTPKNFNGDFSGPVTLRNALAKSINIVSVKLVEKFGMPQVRSLLERAGIRTPIGNAVGLTIALGAPEVTVLDQCVAYSCFANSGMRYDPVMVAQVKNRDGITVPDMAKPAAREEAMKPNVAYVMTHLMEGVCRFGTGANTQVKWDKAEPGRQRAGKTGTSNESRNAWFCGFTTDYTCVIWIGYRDNRPLGHGKEFTGGHMANPVWTDFMIAAEEGLPIEDFEVPDGVEFFQVDRNSGVAGGNFREAFIGGTAPPKEWRGSSRSSESKDAGAEAAEAPASTPTAAPAPSNPNPAGSAETRYLELF